MILIIIQILETLYYQGSTFYHILTIEFGTFNNFFIDRTLRSFIITNSTNSSISIETILVGFVTTFTIAENKFFVIAGVFHSFLRTNRRAFIKPTKMSEEIKWTKVIYPSLSKPSTQPPLLNISHQRAHRFVQFQFSRNLFAFRVQIQGVAEMRAQKMSFSAEY